MNQNLEVGSRFTLQAVGFSMSPEIKPGDLLQVEVIKPDQLHKGDIVLFQKDDKLIAHRIIKTNFAGKIILEKGDGKFLPYEISLDKIKGKVVSVDRGGSVRRFSGLRSRFRGYYKASISYYKYKTIIVLSVLKKRILGDDC